MGRKSGHNPPITNEAKCVARHRFTCKVLYCIKIAAITDQFVRDQTICEKFKWFVEIIGVEMGILLVVIAVVVVVVVVSIVIVVDIIIVPRIVILCVIIIIMMWRQ